VQPGWKRWLALLSLVLTGLLWFNGLVDSFDRPTVGNALQLRQLELVALAAPALPAELQEPLGTEQPRQALREELERQVNGAAEPAAAEWQLQLALLDQQLGDPAVAAERLSVLAGQANPDQRPLLEALAAGQRLSPADLDALARPWPLSPLRRQLLCEQLSRDQERCAEPRQQRAALWRLLGVNGLPVLLVLVGLGLMVRECWLCWRRRQELLAPLAGPALGLIDVTLLIAGGFVVVGELLTPLVAGPLVTALATGLSGDPALQQGVMVLALYLALMAGPLLILRRQLPAAAPAEQRLQWRWRPFASTAGWALSRVLMVLPEVALVGWLVEQLVGDGGGSNPLLELVLTTRNPLALGCFAFTAIVLAPLFEETLFRGVLLPALARRWGWGWGLAISALTFSVAHLSLAELPALAVLGLGLGWLRLRSGRLGSCVLMHGLWNGLTFVNLLLLAG
jgi:membrane protease YdiL (CAAX protease family)